LFGSVVFFGIENPSIEFFSETKLKGALKIWVSFPVFKVKVDQSELSFNQMNTSCAKASEGNVSGSDM